MKQITGIVLLMLLITACSKDYGTMKYKAKFCTTTTKSAQKENSIPLHTIFGDYITSVTPYHFSCKSNMFVFQDNYNPTDPDCHMISFIENREENLDFSGNAEIEFTPVLHSTDIWNGLFKQKEVDFKFISFYPYLFNHEFEIPVQYLNLINSGNFLNGATFHHDAVNNKITVNAMRNFSYGAIHGNANAMPTGYVFAFGETDTSYIYMNKGVVLPEDKRFPFWDDDQVVIRSSKFSTQKIVMPGEGETYTMYATLSFNTNNLIQIYAGNDNIPYTVDDVFVYAPLFWDRVNIKLEMKYN